MLICLNRLILWQCMPSPDTLPAKFNPAVSTDASNSLPFYSTFGRVLFSDNFLSLIASLSHAERTNFDDKKKFKRKRDIWQTTAEYSIGMSYIRSLLKLKGINISQFYTSSFNVKKNQTWSSFLLFKNFGFSFYFSDIFFLSLLSIFHFSFSKINLMKINHWWIFCYNVSFLFR